MNLDRTFPLAAGEITVRFQWEPGSRPTHDDPGEPAGWGEETGVEVRVGPVCTIFLFDVTEALPVCEWTVDDIQTLYGYEHDGADTRGKLLADAVDQIILSEVPEVCVAVQKGWEEILFQRRIEAVSEDGWGTESYIDELKAQLDPELTGPCSPERRAEVEGTLAEQRARLEALKAEEARLQAEYREKYGPGQAA